MGTDTHQIAIEALLDPGQFDHEVQDLRLLETHISWVILTGPYAYKIKKALDLGFLDFSTLERRRFFCQEEIRLNGRLAPHIYLDVVSITGSAQRPRLGGQGPAIEYAVRMHQFPQGGLLDRLAAAGRLLPSHVDEIARLVSRFHNTIAQAPRDSPLGSPEGARAPVEENFRHILPLLREAGMRTRVEGLRAWSEAAFQALSPVIARRKADGHVRECHGDMHLGNMALVDDRIIIFDGIEFNDNLRWIDVMSEVAFLASDLEHRGRAYYSWRFLNAYLEITGDYGGLALLRYYQAYRAMVRAKVTRIRLSQSDLPVADRPGVEAEFRLYVSQAEGYTRPGRARLLLMRGVSGAGKTVISESLLERLGAIRLRSDVERKRLHALAPTDRSGSALAAGLYTPEATARTYAHLQGLAEGLLVAGFPVIVDATFLKRGQREPFRTLADELAVPFIILDIHADEAVLRQRILDRARTGADASEADLAVLESQLEAYGPLDSDEQAGSLNIDGGRPVDAEALVTRLLAEMAAR